MYPRYNHSSATDGVRYMYIMGSKMVKASHEVERYDSLINIWTTMPKLIEEGGGVHLTSCYFRDGFYNECLWVMNRKLI